MIPGAPTNKNPVKKKLADLEQWVNDEERKWGFALALSSSKMGVQLTNPKKDGKKISAIYYRCHQGRPKKKKGVSMPFESTAIKPDLDKEDQECNESEENSAQTSVAVTQASLVLMQTDVSVHVKKTRSRTHHLRSDCKCRLVVHKFTPGDDIEIFYSNASHTHPIGKL